MIDITTGHRDAPLSDSAMLLATDSVARVDHNAGSRTWRARGLTCTAKMWGQRGLFGYATTANVARFVGGAVVTATIAVGTGNIARADPLALAEVDHHPGLIFNQVLRNHGSAPAATKEMRDTSVPASKRRQVVSYLTGELPGTIVIDTANTYLYYVMGGGKAVRYGIGVGREGFTWSGVQPITRKAEWPDWFPPAEMLARQPYLPRVMAGGPGNPLGARAMYLGDTAYRIHGTNQPATIGGHVSSGCIRMLNDDVIDLYDRVDVGAKVVVLAIDARHTAGNQSAAADGLHRSSLY